MLPSSLIERASSSFPFFKSPCVHPRPPHVQSPLRCHTPSPLAGGLQTYLLLRPRPIVSSFSQTPSTHLILSCSLFRVFEFEFVRVVAARQSRQPRLGQCQVQRPAFALPKTHRVRSFASPLLVIIRQLWWGGIETVDQCMRSKQVRRVKASSRRRRPSCSSRRRNRRSSR